jgi:hypothetical protein
LTPACDIAQDKPNKPKFLFYKLYKIIPSLPPNKNEIHKKTGKYVLEKAINFIS